ncbi:MULTISPECIES: hypothetical protein [Acidianus]|jgi:signal recognition particle subunit SRP19|uniref:SRP19 n=2 Tax=Acidianus TaxID=12914 RepID=A0A6A9QDI1_ACIIN|nr:MULTISPECIES: hypothetical protein [Acidianus]MDT7900438.1 hypothetical protein [Acidianus sp.]AEE93778.1 SEC65, signal recognition particle 19 kDa protein [Acidianus hospitalis W1]MCY0873730.1 hypothetical protein [Acidianus infernus]MCY0883754.1 hypothetical protein [Acidianus infernus]MUM64385.1 hypothetical protein [Acidianus infernus]
MSLRDYEGNKIAIWLAYFTADSRRKGRKTKKVKITLDDLFSAAKALGLEPEVLDKVHPGSRVKGLIMVKKVKGKYKLIKDIYSYLQQQKKL